MQQYEAKILEYLEVLIAHHELTYIECAQGTKAERALNETLQAKWAEFPFELRKSLGRIHQAGLTDEPVPLEHRSYKKKVRDAVRASRHTIFRRTQDMLIRRHNGTYPHEDDLNDPTQMLFGVHEKVARDDLHYRMCSVEQLVGHMVKIGLPVANAYGTIPNTEFVWATADSVCPEDPAAIKGQLLDEPIFTSEFSAGDEVSFKPYEVHDVSTYQLRPSGTIELHLETGLQAITRFWHDMTPTLTIEEATETWFRLSDREKLHIIDFDKSLYEEARRRKERIAAMGATATARGTNA